MTETLAELNAAVLQSPHDDAPRLRLAERLTTQGDPRGEFIKVQVEQTQPGLPEETAERLAARERDLLAQHEQDWVGPLADGLGGCVFRRGFIEEVTLDAQVLVARAAEIFGAAPIDSLRIHEAGSLAAELAACPSLARVRRLHIGSADGDSEPLGDAGLAALAASPHLAGLEALSFGMEQIGEGLQALAGASWIGSLRSLDLSGNEIGDDALTSFLSDAPLRRLERLVLDGTGAGLGAVQALAEADRFGELRVLDLSNNQIGGAGLASLAGSAHLPRLAALNLNGAYLEPGSLGPLGTAPWFAQLTELRLVGNNKLELNDLEALLGAPSFPRLTALALGSGKFGDAGAKTVAAATVLRELTQLDVPSCGLTSAGVAALAQSPNLTKLRALELFSNKGTSAAAVAVATSPVMANLRRLGLSNNGITDEGAEALARSKHLTQLCSLSLRANQITDKGIAALAASSTLRHLESLDLAFLGLTDEAAKALAGSSTLSNIESMDVSRHKLSQAGATLLRSTFGRRVNLGR
jgi:uncharacterized protein (TIGR02996 family)